MNASLSNLADNLSEIDKCNCDSESLKNIRKLCVLHAKHVNLEKINCSLD